MLADLTTLSMPDEASIAGPANAAVRMAQTFTIADRDDYGMAADELKSVKAKAKALEAKRETITVPLNKVLKAVNDLFRAPQAALAQAEELLKRSMIAFDNEQERLQREAQARADAIAAAERKRLADEEQRIRDDAAAAQKKIDDEAERIRLAAVEEQRKLDEKAQTEGADHAALLAESQALMVRTETALAETRREGEIVAQAASVEVAAVQMTADVVTAPVVTSLRGKVSGISTAKKWTFKVTNLHDLVRHIATHPQFLSLLKADEIQIRRIVSALGDQHGLPGVEATQEKTMSARAAA